MAVKPGRIALEAQNSMRGSGHRLSSPCEALRRVFEGGGDGGTEAACGI